MSFGVLMQPRPLLVLYAGESPSGGLGGNTYATAGELAKRRLRILNNTTLLSFDSLDVGTNNLTGHLGLIYASADAHGFEIELANRYDDGDFGTRKVYLCKAGQGGTRISMWADEATYSAESQTVEPYDTFIARVQAAISIIESETGLTPLVVMFWNMGINDAGIGTNEETFKTTMKDVFALMRTDLGITLPIYMTQYQDITPIYDDEMQEITTEIDDAYVIPTNDAETVEVFAGAGYHFGYTGSKVVSGRMIDLLLTHIHNGTY